MPKIDRDSSAGIAPLQRQLIDKSGPKAFGETAAAVAVGVVPDLADSIVSSVSHTVPGVPKVKRGFLSKQIPLARQAPEAVEAASGVAGIVAASLIAPEATGLNFVHKLAKGSKIARTLIASDRQVEAAKKVVARADLAIARRGETGVTALRGTANVLNHEIKRDKLATAARLTAARRGLTQGVATEALILATLNQNAVAVPSESGMATLGAFAALGVTLPTALDTLAMGAAFRRNLNSDTISRAAAHALDAGSDVVGIKKRASENAFMRREGSTETVLTNGGPDIDIALAESLQARARETAPTGDGLLRTNRDKARAQNQKLANDAMHRVTMRGSPGAEGSAWALADDAASQTLRDLAANDPMGLHGIEALGRAGDDGFDGLIVRKDAHVTKLREEAQAVLATQGAPQAAMEEATKQLQRASFMDSWQPTIIDRGEILPASAFSKRGKNFDGVIQAEDLQVGKGSLRQFHTPDTGMFLRSDGQLNIPRGRTLADLSFREMSSLYAMGRKVIDRAVASKSPFVVPEKPTSFQLDMAEQILRESDDILKVQFTQGMDRQSAMVESLAQKAQALNGKPNITLEDLPTLRDQFNLPPITSVQRTQVGDTDTAVELLMRELGSPAKIRAMPLQEIRQRAAGTQVGEDGLASIGPAEIDLLGSSFSPNVSPFVKSGDRAVEPIMAWRRPLGDQGLLDGALLESRLMDAQGTAIGHLLDDQAGPLVRTLANDILDSPDLENIVDIAALQEATRAKSLAPAQVQRSNFLASQEFGARDVKPLLGAQRVRRQVLAISDRNFDEILESTVPGQAKPITEVFAELKKPSNLSARKGLEQFVNARKGFSLSGEVREAADGSIEFLLKQDSQDNIGQWKVLTGQDSMPKDAVLPMSNGSPLGLNAKAFGAVQAFDEIASATRKEINTILKANGLTTLPKQDFYIPPESIAGKFQAFIFDGGEKPIRRILANTEEQLNEQIAHLKRDKSSILNRNNGAQIYTQGEVEEKMSLLSRAHTAFLDPSIPAVQAGRRAVSTGAGASPFATGREIGDVIESFRNQYRQVGIDTIETVFRPQINEAKVRAASIRKTSRLGRQVDAPANSIEQDYVNALLGKKAINSESSELGNIIHPFEGFLNARMRDGYSRFTSLTKGLSKAKYRKEFDRLSEELGARQPFSNAAELIAEKELQKVPPTVADLSTAMNQLATRLLLRYDTAHAVLNLAGVAATLPAVARTLIPKAGEGFAEVAQRLGRNADIFQTPSGKIHAVFSVEKAMARSIRYMLNAKSHADWDYAVMRGNLDAPLSEMHKQLSLVDNSATWTRVFKGDPTAKSLLKRKGVDGMLALVSDKSEEMARSWAYFTGLEMAELAGVTNRAAKHSLAKQVADRTIANFDPLNRPQIFQSPGVGSSLGLFQSYIFNYYSRIFGYLERGQSRVLATQAAAQALTFGGNTVPGVSQFNDLVFGASKGETDLFDGVYERFPQQVADTILHGVPSTIPLMFGADRDSAPALFTRGDTEVRLPGVAGVPPGANVALTIMKGVGAGIDLFKKDNPGITDQQVGEILQAHVANRPLSAMISMYWTDALVDRRGSKIADETNTALGRLIRHTGLKTLAQQSQIEASWRYRQSDAMRQQRRDTLTKNTRALIRGDKISNEQLGNAFQAFIDTGGSPSEFGGYLKRTARSATTPRAQRELENLLKNPDKFEQRMGNIMRLMNAVSPSEPEE